MMVVNIMLTLTGQSQCKRGGTLAIMVKERLILAVGFHKASYNKHLFLF